MSRLIKSGWANPNPLEQKVISIRTIVQPEDETQFNIDHVFEKSKDEIILDAQNEANSILKNANEEAEKIIQQINMEKKQWEHEKQQLAVTAQEEGFNQGILQGRDQGYIEFQELIQTAQEVVVASKNEYQKLIDSADQTILNIALSVAEKILNQKLENHEQFFPIVKGALKEAKEYREVQLHIHPSQYGFLLSQKDELMSLFPRETDFYLYPDYSLDEWSCIIESSNGRIDASIDSQLKEMKKKLLELVESE
ncbi:flagellar assembly protein FliH [Neobacillus sp. D3-1R]|uniref:flagellar assembly protein FliH n=1 Tax=Neobacillus sp. D3-1R TaxID=3445778 RepID=UPI003F9F5B8E